MKTRHQFLDVYRGIVVLFMIQGHTVRELLTPLLHETAAFRMHEVFHGITGAGFLFGAGITFGLSAQSRWAEYLMFSPSLRRRLKKIVLLLGIGYALHLPFLSLGKILSDTTDQGWRELWSFDVLQCIGISLLILQLLVLVIRKERWFAGCLGALMIAVVYGAPIIWREGESLPVFLRYALTGINGSIYPLVPHAAFLFAGALVSYEFLRFVRLGKEALFMKRLALTGVTLHVAGFLQEIVSSRLYGSYDYWSTGPDFFLIKLGAICLLMSAAWYLSEGVLVRQYPALLQWVIVVGVESLFVYVVHLIILYGSVVNPGLCLSEMWFQSLGWGGSVGVTVIFAAFLVFAAWSWNMMKNTHPILVKGVNWWMGTVMVVEFLIRAY